MARFTLYGSPHSLPTYKVALMLCLSAVPFSFRYVSFQKGMHKAPEFKALSRWGQVPVLLEGERVSDALALADAMAAEGGPKTWRGVSPVPTGNWDWLDAHRGDRRALGRHARSIPGSRQCDAAVCARVDVLGR